jgi:hypothetical protein
MALGISEQTEKTLLRHWQAFGAGDVEAIMADYAEDAVLITPDGTLKGHAQIRSLFAQVFATIFPPDSTSLHLAKQIRRNSLHPLVGKFGPLQCPVGHRYVRDARRKDRRANICCAAGSEIRGDPPGATCGNTPGTGGSGDSARCGDTPREPHRHRTSGATSVASHTKHARASTHGALVITSSDGRLYEP